jgi:hypothetical protein
MSGETCTLPSASGDITGLNIGIAVRDGLKPSGVSGSPAATPGGYADGDIVSVLIKGRAWVALEDSATAGNQPYVRYSGTNPAGGYSSASDSGHNVQAAGVRFFTTAAASLAVVSLNMPQ